MKERKRLFYSHSLEKRGILVHGYFGVFKEY